MLVPERISPPEASGAPESRLPVCELWMLPFRASLVVEAADEEHLLAEVGRAARAPCPAPCPCLRPWPTTPCRGTRCRRRARPAAPAASLALRPAGGSSPQTLQRLEPGQRHARRRGRGATCGGRTVVCVIGGLESLGCRARAKWSRPRRRHDLMQGIGDHCIAPADLAELPAPDDRLDRGADAVIVRFRARLASRRAAARRRAAPRGPARSPAACGRTAARSPRGGRVSRYVRKPVEPSNCVPSMSFALRVDRAVAQVLLAAPADRVVSLRGRSRTGRSADGRPRTSRRCVCFSTSWRTVRPSVAASSSGSCGTPLGGLGSRSPSRTSLIQLPRRIGLVRDAPDCLARVVARPGCRRGRTAFTPSTRRHSARRSRPGMP